MGGGPPGTSWGVVASGDEDDEGAALSAGGRGLRGRGRGGSSMCMVASGDEGSMGGSAGYVGGGSWPPGTRARLCRREGGCDCDSQSCVVGTEEGCS